MIAHLLANAGVSAVLGTRINWVQRQQGGAVPAAVLHRISGTRNYAYGGPTSFVTSRVQIDCYGTSYTSAKSAARAIIAALNGVAFDRNGINFRGAFIDGERDTFEGEERLHRTSVDVLVNHSE